MRVVLREKFCVKVRESLQLFVNGVVVVVACPENCVSCTYNTGISNTMCEASGCKTRYAQNTAADRNTCHGTYYTPATQAVREPTGSFIAQSVRLVGEGPQPQAAS